MREVLCKALGGLIVVLSAIGMVWIIVQVVKVTHEMEREKAQAWIEFIKLHDCKVVSKTLDKSMPTTSFTTDGKVAFGSTTIKGSTGWLCNDGVTYYR